MSWRLGQDWISSLKLVMWSLMSAQWNQINYVFLLVKRADTAVISANGAVIIFEVSSPVVF